MAEDPPEPTPTHLPGNIDGTPLRERIEQQIRRNLIAHLATVADANIQRFDDERNQPIPGEDGELPDVWIVITAGDDDVLQEDYAIGTEDQSLPITVDIHLRKGAQPADMTLSQWANTWIAAVRKSLRLGALLIEADTEEQLAQDTAILGTFAPQPSTCEREYVCGVEAEVQYRFDDADPV